MTQVLQSAPENSAPYLEVKAELDAEPEIPACLEHVYRWFWELDSRRQYGMSGPNPITHQEIKAWIELKDVLIHSFEIDIITKLDSAYISFKAKKQNERMKRKK